MTYNTSLNDIIGIESVKLGFFKELQRKIYELKASNVEINQKKHDLKCVLDGIPDVVAVINDDHTVSYVNKSFYDTYSKNNPKGLKCFDVFKGDTKPCQSCPLERAKKESLGLCRQLQIFNINGENRQIECTASFMHNFMNEQNKILVIQRDVTLEKHYQAKYMQTERMATVGVLAEGVAHEINSPLTSIGGFTEALIGRLKTLRQFLEKDPEGVRLLNDFDEYLQTIHKEYSRCSDIIQNLLTFGHKENQFSIVNLNNIVRNSINLLKPKLKHLKPDSLHIYLDKQDPAVMGHHGELMQVALNLIHNALYAIDNHNHHGEISIITSTYDDIATLTVKDTGHGINEEDIDKLFDPFFTTKPVGEGTGIGLSSCYNIVKQHGGDIDVAGRPGEGAVFQVILPHFPE
jgi:signal transduction histidine kinase